jgi:hypothetical protein
MKRHLARIANTDQRIVVVFMQIPDREDHALVVSTDNLPPRWEQALMSVVESPEGQGDPNLGNVLARRLMPDTTDTVLQSLHQAGLLIPVPVNNVIMFPEPNRPFALRQILQAMGKVLPDEYAAVDALNEAKSAKATAPSQPRTSPVGQHKTPVDPFANQEKFNPHTSNHNAQASENDIGIANGLLMEAQMLEQDAANKRERAYQHAPHLRPQPKRVPPPAKVQVTEAKTPVKAKAKASAKRATPSRAKKANG